MTHEISAQRMQYLSDFEGSIGIEDVGDPDICEIVIRIPLSHATAENENYALGNMR